MTLTKEQQAVLRKKLEEEQAEVQRQLTTHGRRETETGEWRGSSAFDNAGEEPDPADVADQIEELVTNVPLVSELEARLRDIDDALQKMDDGTYGVCEVSGEEIPLKRLMANPAARTIIAHAR